MKKKIICVFLSVIIAISGCGKYDNWTSVEMEECGTVKFPEDWEVIEKDGFYIVSDIEKNVKFIGYECDAYKENKMIDFSVSGYNISIENRDDIDFCTSEVFSNSAITGEKPIKCNDKKIEDTYYINLDGDESEIEYICIDRTDINYDLIIKIAKSFCMELD